MIDQTERFTPGMRVEVTQQIPHGTDVWDSKIQGAVVSYRQKKTGSWYAHAKDEKLWLDRLMLRKDDGELIELSLDGYTHIKVLG